MVQQLHWVQLWAVIGQEVQLDKLGDFDRAETIVGEISEHDRAQGSMY